VLALALGLPLTYAYRGARTFGYLARAAGLMFKPLDKRLVPGRHVQFQDEQRDRDNEHGAGARLEAGDGRQADLRAAA
jgi:ribosomal protein L34